MCVYIKNTLFKKEWEQLEKYYKKKHTHDEANFYYSMLKDLSDEDFKQTLKNVYNHCKYFPNIAEIREQVPNKQDAILSNFQNVKYEPLDEEDKEWCRKFYKKYCDSEEEYQKRLKDNGLVD